MDTTIAKTTHAAETLAASLMIHEVIKDVETAGSFEEHTQKSEMLAIIIMSTFQPAEA